MSDRLAAEDVPAPSRPGRAGRGRRLLTALEVVLIGAVGAVVGIVVAGSVTTEVGPFEARLSLQPAVHGSTVVAVPPLGQLQLATHKGPVRLEVDITQLRADAAQSIARDPDQLRTLGDQVKGDLRGAVEKLVLRTVLATVLGATILGLLVFRRSRRVIGTGVAGLAALGALAATTAATVDSRALAQPRFTGLLATAPTAFGDVRDLLANVDAYGLQLGRLVTNVTKLYTVAQALPTFTPDDGTLRILSVSDLHLSPTAFEIIGSVVQQYGIDVVVDAGDDADLGTAAEARYIDGVGRLGVPYVWVRGNHDGRLIQAAMERQPNATVLDSGQVVQVAGVRVLGRGDPRFTPDKSTGDDDAPRSVLTAVGEQLLADYRASLVAPDLVVVHEPAMAAPLLGTVPLVIVGHTHKRETTTEDGTTLLVQGSTGGAGARALEGDAPTPVTLSVLYLDPRTRTLQAYDDITLGGLGTSDASIKRHVVAFPEPAPEATASADAGAQPSPSASPTASPEPGPSPTPS